MIEDLSTSTSPPGLPYTPVSRLKKNERSKTDRFQATPNVLDGDSFLDDLQFDDDLTSDKQFDDFEQDTTSFSTEDQFDSSPDIDSAEEGGGISEILGTIWDLFSDDD